jgi:phospholipid transport system substrate-binding protein
MLTRRTMIAVAAATPVLVCYGRGREAWAQGSPQAVALVKTICDQLVSAVNATGSVDDKRRRLRQIIDTSVDVDNVARFCLGRFWQTATAEQRQLYVARFHELLVAEVSGHLGEYRGVDVTIGQARTNGETEIVKTTVTRPGTPAKHVDWVVGTSTGSPKVVDLLAEGISMRLTHSADFKAFLSQHQNDVQALIESMNTQIAAGW